MIEVLAQGVIGDDREKLGARTEDSFGRVTKALQNPIFEKQEVEAHSTVLDDLRERFVAVRTGAEPRLIVGDLDEAERKAFSRFCDLVYECAPNAAAKSVVDKILIKLRAG